MSILDFFTKQSPSDYFRDKLKQKKPVMRFEVGEGLSGEQKEQAEEVVRKRPTFQGKTIKDYFLEANKALPQVRTPIEAIQKTSFAGKTIKDYFLEANKRIPQIGEAVGEGITGLAFGDVRKTGIKGIPEHIWETEKDISRFFIKFVPSAIQAFKEPGKVEEKSWNIPILGEIETFQKGANRTFDNVIDGKEPLWHALIPFVEVPLSATFTSGLLKSGARKALTGIKVNSNETAGAIKEMGLKDLSAETQKTQYRKLAHDSHPDLGGSQKAFTELNQANSILNKARSQGLLFEEKKLAMSMRQISEAGLVEIKKFSDIGKIKKIFQRAEQPYLGVKGLLPEVAGTIPTQPLQARQQAMGMSIRDIKAKPIKPSDKALEVMRKPEPVDKFLEVRAVEWLKTKTKQEIASLTEILKPVNIRQREFWKTSEPQRRFESIPQPLEKSFREEMTNRKELLNRKLEVFNNFLEKPDEYIKKLNKLPELKQQIQTTSDYLRSSKIKNIIPNIRNNEIETISGKAVKTTKEVAEEGYKIPDAQRENLLVRDKPVSKIEELETQLNKKYLAKADEVNQTMADIWTEMTTSEKGQRFYYDPQGFDTRAVSQPSSFPDWMPSHLRSRKLFDKVQDNLIKLAGEFKYPEGIRKRRIYNAILDEVDARTGVDTFNIREQLIKNYEKPKQITKVVGGGAEGGIQRGIDLKKLWGTEKAKKAFREMARDFPEPEQRAGIKGILEGIEKKTAKPVSKIAPASKIAPVEALKAEEGMKLLTSPDKAGEGFVMKGLPKKTGLLSETRIKKEIEKTIKDIASKKLAAEALATVKKSLSGFDNFIDITKIERKNIPYKEMNIAERIVGDKTYPAIRKSGFYATKEIQTAPVSDIYSQKLSPHLMALRQDGYNLGGKFGTVFSKIWKPTENAIRAEKEFSSKNVKAILDLGKKYKIKADKKNLEHLSDVVEKKVKATPNEELYIAELRKTLDGLRDQTNVVREAMGKNRMGYIEDYIPHIQKASIWSDLLSNEATISDNLDFIIPNQTKNPFAYKRLLEEMAKPERNLYVLLDRYISVIGKDIYYTPAIENIKAYNSVLKGREKIKAAQYWDEYIRQGLIGKQHKIDTALGIGQKTRRGLQKWNDMVNKAFLTGKVAWNLATQPLSYMMPGISEIGVRNSVKGIYKGFNKGLRQYVKENSNVLNIKSRDVHAIAVGEGRNIQSRIYRTKIDKYNDFISMLGAIEERELTMASYIGGLERAKGLGYKGDDALWFADLSAAKSQSMYNRENRALILNSDITRTIFPFQSFSIEMHNHIKEIFAKSGGAYKLDNRQRVGKLFGLIVGIYLANKYSEALTGNKKTTLGTFVPFLGGAAVDPMIAKMKGEQFYGGRSPITVIQIGEDIIKGSQDYIKHGSTKRLRKVGVNFGLALRGIGGGGQINNLIDGIMANIDEDVKNVKGETMFEVKDAISKIKAPIFGVWATKEGREYWLPKEKTAYEKAAEEDKEKDRKAKKKVKPIYNKIQKLKKEDRQEEAKALVDKLSDEEWDIYKKMLSADKTKETNKLKDEFYSKFLEIQELKKTDWEAGKKMVDSLSGEEWRIYKLLRDQLE